MNEDLKNQLLLYNRSDLERIKLIYNKLHDLFKQISWEKNLRSLSETLSATGEFRHGIPFIPVSSIAGQYFCELKVDHEYTKGEIPSEAKAEGVSMHMELLAMKKTNLDRIIEGIQKKLIHMASFPVVARFKDLIIGGKPDSGLRERQASLPHRVEDDPREPFKAL